MLNLWLLSAQSQYGVITIALVAGKRLPPGNLGFLKENVNNAMHGLGVVRKPCVNVGVLLAKMTPFRSCSVILNTALAICVLGEVQLKGGILTYAVVSASLSPFPCNF